MHNTLKQVPVPLTLTCLRTPKLLHPSQFARSPAMSRATLKALLSARPLFKVIGTVFVCSS